MDDGLPVHHYVLTHSVTTLLADALHQASLCGEALKCFCCYNMLAVTVH